MCDMCALVRLKIIFTHTVAIYLSSNIKIYFLKCDNLFGADKKISLEPI